MTEKKPKRPRDPNQLARMVVDIATGEREEPSPPVKGKAGGEARAVAVGAKRRREIARNAAKARWESPAPPEKKEQREPTPE